jgi:hypothetical protein
MITPLPLPLPWLLALSTVTTAGATCCTAVIIASEALLGADWAAGALGAEALGVGAGCTGALTGCAVIAGRFASAR